jgi:hypothetical protein
MSPRDRAVCLTALASPLRPSFARLVLTLVMVVSPLAAAPAPAWAQHGDVTRADSGGGSPPVLRASEYVGGGMLSLPLETAAEEDFMLRRALDSLPPVGRVSRYVVVDLNARRLWYIDGDTLRFAAPVGVGKDTPPQDAGVLGRHATPRTLFTVLRKEREPVWVPPDWYYTELAAETGRPLLRLQRRDTVRAIDGSVFYVARGEVMQRLATGRVQRVALTDSAGARRELEVDGRIVVPPIGSTQRRYPNVLGPRRLVFRDGYAIHGTDQPETIGLAASHGCVRMRNEDVVVLYALVTVGTPVFLR